MNTSFSIPNANEILLFQEKLLHWYHINGRIFIWREPTATQYEKLIAELLLQRTKAELVNSFISKFLEKFPSWIELAHAKESEIEVFLRPIGLSQRRAKSLHDLSVVLVARGELFPKEHVELEMLPGVGQYIANAIRLLILNEPEPLLDVNMQRVLERNFGPRKLSDIRYDPCLQELSKIVITVDNPVHMNFAILDFAALICKARKPMCDVCILAKNCLYFKAMIVAA